MLNAVLCSIMLLILLPANNPLRYIIQLNMYSETEYPFPSGIYLARLISLVQKWPNNNRTDDPLIELVSNNYVPPGAKKKKNKNPGSVFGNKYPKEITESMAMVDALERALKLCLGRSTCSFQTSSSSSSTTSVRVYCVGDGKYPITAAAMALNYPYPGWEFVSIDPLLDPIELNDHPHNLVQFTGLSQDYILPDLPPVSTQDDDDDDAQSSETEKVEYVDIVVACHSHAPLQEFWDRVLKRIHSNQNGGGGGGCRAVAITMACCANYSDIIQPPNLVFDDYEVYSPKRQIRIYNDNLVCTLLGD